eukprot:1184252-Prorocentrum_minimum.AAC.2
MASNAQGLVYHSHVSATVAACDTAAVSRSCTGAAAPPPSETAGGGQEGVRTQEGVVMFAQHSPTSSVEAHLSSRIGTKSTKTTLTCCAAST